MWTTLEIRWFSPGQIPSSMQTWWHQDCFTPLPCPLERRTDVYLVLPHRPDLGIKKRQGKIEIKQRSAELGFIPINNNLVGQAEQWTKAIYTQSQLDYFLIQNQLSHFLWLQVEKERQQKIFQGCTVEMTQLKVAKQNWWTFAFEQLIESPETQNIEGWEVLVQGILQDLDLCQNPELHSCGYPQWLSILSTCHYS